MGLKQDYEFKKDVKKYWSLHKNIITEIDRYLDGLISTDENIKNIILEFINIIKTSDTISESYSDCFYRISKLLTENYSHDSFGSEHINVNKLTSALVLKRLIIKGYYEIFPVSTAWDEYYYSLCNKVAANSKCFSRKVGTVLVRDKTIIGTGYNGAPRGVPPCDERWDLDEGLRQEFKNKFGKEFNPDDVKGKCPRRVINFESGTGLEWCVAGHGERNALIQAAREGICTKHSILYMNCAVPCTPCLVEIINAGVEEIVITDFIYYDVSAKYILENSQLKARIYNFM